MEFVEESNLLVLNKLERLLTVCKVKNIDDIDLSKEFYFIGKTDEEISLVCETEYSGLRVPPIRDRIPANRAMIPLCFQ